MPLSYSCEITIDLPRERVIELMEDVESLPKWQDGLQSVEHIEGGFAQVGSKMRMMVKMGKREVEIIETMTERDLPDRIAFTYDADGVHNPLANTFSELPDGKTRWQIDTTFHCKGIPWLMSILMPGMFKKQTRKMMQDFKSFAEAA